MSDFNKVILVGNLTKDPEIYYTPKGNLKVNLRIAINRRYKKQEELREEVCFVTIVVFGKQAESCKQFLQKGRKILVEGRLQTHSYEDKTLQKHSILEVMANNIMFLSAPNRPEKLEEENDFSATE